MAYRFERGFATVHKGVRKIAVDLMDDAISCASAKGEDVHETVHATRKACKKLRGLIRLVRPVFNDYRAENATFRDAGRKFSFLRDSGVLIETYDSLLKCYKDEIDRFKFAPIRRHMTLREKEQAGRDDIPDMLKEFCATMMEARKRASRWHISGDGFNSLDGGLSKSYKGARRAMSEASKEPTAEAVHEWRKRVKDHWCHARLLCSIWPKLMKAYCEVADRLGDTLGKHHDLEVFQQRLVEEDYGDPQVIEVLSALARRRQKVLEEEAFSIGARLLAESAASLTSRWKFYWEAWRENEPRAAALAA